MNHHRRSAQVWHVFSRDLSVYLHTHTFIRNRNEPYLPLPSQPQLVLIYRPRRDERLSSRPWCEVAQAEIRTRNLPTANPALYHSATSAPGRPVILVFLKNIRCYPIPRGSHSSGALNTRGWKFFFRFSTEIVSEIRDSPMVAMER